MVETRSPDDESCEKLECYAELGVPECWIIERDSKRPEIFQLHDGSYKKQEESADGWVSSQSLPYEMKPDSEGKLRIRPRDGSGPEEALPY